MNDVTSKTYILRLTVTLFLVTAVVALLLSFVNAVTKDTIAEKARQKLSAALCEVMPEADDEFSDPIYDDGSCQVYKATSGGRDLGWCIKYPAFGYGGELTLAVGVSESLEVTGVAIVEHSETAGMGSKADNPDWLSQFVGRSGAFTLKGDGDHIDAVTGATVTSRAVTAGVNGALELAAQIKGGEK
ncbi:MAG: RnfABCDGE type electron transport complex subunit G [Oscillospiraceae bacterium]|nr:RnfABCDGE type electron transport complex subunit G [Oscillospiraceae bacterium]